MEMHHWHEFYVNLQYRSSLLRIKNFFDVPLTFLQWPEQVYHKP